MNSSKCKIAALGECLIELSGTAFGTLRQSFGGDTLNTATYLARLTGDSADIQYVTAVGTDSLSETMLQHWRSEGIDAALTLRDARRLPGLYQIQVDGDGERRFLYWRSESAARFLLQHADFDRVRIDLASANIIYLSGISLAVLPEADRTTLTDLLRRLAADGVTIAFDTNYRASLWSSSEAAQAAVMAILPATQMLFATFDDERALWGDANLEATLARYHAFKVPMIVIKRGVAGCVHSDGVQVSRIPAFAVPYVVDTTAAGDSFNAAFIASQLAGMTARQCCEAANDFAGIIIQHQGAIIPVSATPSLRQLFDRRNGLA